MPAIEITMQSDWHVGTGMGRGELDSIVQRDGDNLPYIPGKTLTGILRDSCEQVALGLDRGNNHGVWHDWVNFIFGDQPALAKGAIEAEPKPALVAIGSAHLDEKLKEALKDKPKLQEAIAFMKPGVAIDPKTGTAKPDFLRFEEVVRLNAKLKAEIELSLPNNLSATDKKVIDAILASGAKLTERLGGKRRRGNGRCQLKISGYSDDEIKWLKNHYATINSPPAYEGNELISTENNPEHQPPWHIIPLTIKTLSPIVLPSRTVGNVVECLDYIPGRYLLGHIHQTLGQYFDVSQAIATGELIITNATVKIDGQGGRPTPFFLFGEKLDGGLSKGKGVYNRFQEPEPKGIQLKGERGGYLGPFDGRHLPKTGKANSELFTHNTIQDDVQRPTSDVGGVYSYEAILANQTFTADLRLPDSLVKQIEAKEKQWQGKLKGEIRIGQSKKDQYGKIVIAPGNSADLPKPIVNNQTLSVWFLADVLLRGDRLNINAGPDDLRKHLEKALGVKLRERQDPELISVALRTRRTESWQVRWGLPRPSLLGWQAGSCLIYDIESGSIDAQKLQELMIVGIGDRRTEGYGQISFNDPLLSASLKNLTAKSETTPNQTNNRQSQLLPNNHPSHNYARIVEKAAWREAIQNKALALAASPQKREEILGIRISNDGNSQPTMTQLGALRSVLRKLQSANNKSIIISWLSALESVANRKEKWSNSSQGLTKIRNLVNQQNLIWNNLNIDFLPLTITQNGVDQLKSELWAEAVRTLVDAIIRGHKRDLEKAQERNQEAA
jgi:CRISPR-associated protein Csx10